MIECPSCHSVLPKWYINTTIFSPCPSCRKSLEVFAFPALFRPPVAEATAEPLVLSDQANCYYHAEKKAVIPCSNCGRFLCSLCDIEFEQQHLCPQCLQSGNKKKRLRQLNSDVCCYDKVAFGLACYPILTVFFTFVTAPIALYVAIRYWKTTSITGSKARMVFAILFAVIEIALWIFIIGSGIAHG